MIKNIELYEEPSPYPLENKNNSTKMFRNKLISLTKSKICLPLLIFSTLDKASNLHLDISEELALKWINSEKIYFKNMYNISKLSLLNFREAEKIYKNAEYFDKFILFLDEFKDAECIKKMLKILNSYSDQFANMAISESLKKYYIERFDLNSSSNLKEYKLITSTLFEDLIYEIPNEIVEYICENEEYRILVNDSIKILPKEKNPQGPNLAGDNYSLNSMIGKVILL